LIGSGKDISVVKIFLSIAKMLYQNKQKKDYCTHNFH
jgi:hypothetical protein